MATCLIIAALTGCATGQSQEEINPSLRQPCRPIQQIESTQGKDTLKGTATNAAIFWECSDKMDALIEATEPKNKK